MTIYDLKPAFQKLLRPACNALAKMGITANQVTIAAMFLSIVTGTALAALHDERWVLFLVPFALFLRMALNAIDGMLAREHGMQSALGGLLNELGDHGGTRRVERDDGRCRCADRCEAALRWSHGQE
jgi:CDP-diacylglycerol--glycerol-3-phosphate 3-phosphatidyltransferase